MKKLLLTLVLAGVILAGAGYWLTSSSRSTPAESEFTTAAGEYGTVVEAINATGFVQPRDVTAVGSVLSGEVVAIYPGADFNQTVTKGQELLKLDDRAARLKVDQARETLDLAKSDVVTAQAARDAAQTTLERANRFLEKGIGKQEDVNQATQAVRVAEARIESARIKVREAEEGVRAAQLGFDLTTVRAPTDGVIIDRKVVLGQMVAPPASAQLFTIASDLKKMQVNAQIAEGDVGKVRPGLKATFTVYAYAEPSDTFEGTVRENRLLATNLQGAVFFPAIIDVENREARAVDGRTEWMLRPGMTATVDIQRRVHENAWKMPTAALSFQLDEHYQTPEAKAKLARLQELPDREDWQVVWILKDKKPWPLFVRTGGKNRSGETGVKDGQFTEVLQWDPEMGAGPTPATLADYRFIIAAPPVTKPGIFDRPSLKLS